VLAQQVKEHTIQSRNKCQIWTLKCWHTMTRHLRIYYLKRGQQSKNTSPTIIWTSFLLSFYIKIKCIFNTDSPSTPDWNYRKNWLHWGISPTVYKALLVYFPCCHRISFHYFQVYLITAAELSQIYLSSSFATKQFRLFMWDLATS